MTTVTLATIATRPQRIRVPLRWEPADLGRPTTMAAADGLAEAERTHLTLVAARLFVLMLLGTGAVVAGALIGRL